MKRTTVTLPDDVDARLRLEARRRGTSIADVVREAIDRQLLPAGQTGALQFFAVGEGHPDDVSERIDEYVGETMGIGRISTTDVDHWCGPALRGSGHARPQPSPQR